LEETRESPGVSLGRARDPESAALAEQGRRLLVGGTSEACLKGLALLREASRRGSAEAAQLLSVCAAWGVAQPRDLRLALSFLESAARLGSSSALSELRILARDPTGDPATLRRRIDLRSWTTPTPARSLRERPRVTAFERFLSPEECDWLIERGRPGLKRAQVYRQSSTPKTAETRTNSEADFTIFRADVVLSLIRDRISNAAGVPVSHFEITKLLHYAPGEQFALHADFIEPRTPELVRQIQMIGQRALTFLVYLNEDYEGGATHFPKLGLQNRGARGDALLFSNVDAAGAPDYDTLHAGLPPTRGEKWLLSQWIRTRAITPG
jgi:hypothetical protein